MSFEIVQINNGWLLRFHSETGFHQFFFEDFDDAVKIMKEAMIKKIIVKKNVTCQNS